MDRQKERKIKNITQYILAIITVVFALFLLYSAKLTGKEFITIFLLAIVVLQGNDLTDVLEIYLERR
ncbi:MAG: hypothetical protein ACOCRO_00475 [Halanaerobiales bacterium]